MCEKGCIWHPATCNCENGKYLGSIIDNSVITYDEFIEGTKTIPIKTVPTKSTSTNFYILIAFLLIAISLLIDVTLYCYWIKHQSKQNQNQKNITTLVAN